MKSIFLDQNDKFYFGFVMINNATCICDNTLKSFKSKFQLYKSNIKYYLTEEYYGLFNFNLKDLESNHFDYIKILKNEKTFAKWINKFKFYPCETDHGGWNEEKGILHLSDAAIKWLYKDLRDVFGRKAIKTYNQMKNQFQKMNDRIIDDLEEFNSKLGFLIIN